MVEEGSIWEGKLEKTSMVIKGEDIWGGNYYTNTEVTAWEYHNGTWHVKSTQATTTGVDSFGATYTTITTTNNTITKEWNADFTGFSYQVSSATVTTSTEGKDIFGQ